ncbi:MAG: hypothetical protein [Arizlama microvirus]|nr:MAG: hypothetical protein [Arizlama microvirus]
MDKLLRLNSLEITYVNAGCHSEIDLPQKCQVKLLILPDSEITLTSLDGETTQGHGSGLLNMHLENFSTLSIAGPCSYTIDILGRQTEDVRDDKPVEVPAPVPVAQSLVETVRSVLARERLLQAPPSKKLEDFSFMDDDPEFGPGHTEVDPEDFPRFVKNPKKVKPEVETDDPPDQPQSEPSDSDA